MMHTDNMAINKIILIKINHIRNLDKEKINLDSFTKNLSLNREANKNDINRVILLNVTIG